MSSEQEMLEGIFVLLKDAADWFERNPDKQQPYLYFYRGIIEAVRIMDMEKKALVYN